jgi:hypothetical protein
VSRPTSPDSAGVNQGPAADPALAVVAVVKDLFFVARIRETARLLGVPLTFARSPEELERALTSAPRFVLLDLTTGFDHDTMLSATAARGVPVLAFTTHALARETQPWHARCARVVTKETLTRELPSLLRDGVAS